MVTRKKLNNGACGKISDKNIWIQDIRGNWRMKKTA